MNGPIKSSHEAAQKKAASGGKTSSPSKRRWGGPQENAGRPTKYTPERDALTAEWENYPKEARYECASDGRDSWSYLEVMTCFQMLDWIKHPDSIGGVTGAGATHAKNEARPPLQLEAAPEKTDPIETPNP
jgi:hypothetical protein